MSGGPPPGYEDGPDGLPVNYLVSPCSRFTPEAGWPGLCRHCGYGRGRHTGHPLGLADEDVATIQSALDRRFPVAGSGAVTGGLTSSLLNAEIPTSPRGD